MKDAVTILNARIDSLLDENKRLREALEHVGDVVIGMKTSQEKAYALEVINLALEQNDE